MKEASIAFGVILALAVVLTILFSSPDEHPSTIQSWSRSDPVDFVTTATTELDGSSATGGYGPPYNHACDGQHEWFIHLAEVVRGQPPVNTAQDFVLAPLRAITGRARRSNPRSPPMRTHRQPNRQGGRAPTRRP